MFMIAVRTLIRSFSGGKRGGNVAPPATAVIRRASGRLAVQRPARLW